MATNGRLVSALIVLIAGWSALWTPALLAQDKYPTRPIRILIPFPAAGAADTIGRSIGDQLAAQMGQPVVVDNRPGAAGRLATEMLAKAEPDGYTLLVGGVGPLAISPTLYKKLPYDTERDFVPLTRVAEIINVMVVHPSSGAATPKQFIDWAKKRGGDVRFGSSGPGQFDHLVGEFFQRETDLKMTHVPYKGGGPALIDVIAGQVQIVFSPPQTGLPHVKARRVRAIGMTSLQRIPTEPDIPAIAEAVPGYEATNWHAMIGPRGLPAAVVERISGEVRKIISQKDVETLLHNSGVFPAGGGSPEEVRELIRKDFEQWARVVQQAGVKAE